MVFYNVGQKGTGPQSLCEEQIPWVSVTSLETGMGLQGCISQHTPPPHPPQHHGSPTTSTLWLAQNRDRCWMNVVLSTVAKNNN